jgi:hypothetical protein
MPLPFDLSAVDRKKFTVDFNGGPPSFSDAGLLVLREAEHWLGVCRRLAAAMVQRSSRSFHRRASGSHGE